MNAKMLLAGAAIAFAISASSLPALAADYANPHLLVSTATLNEMLERKAVRVIDVRAKADYDSGHIPEALSISADSVNDPNAHVDGARLPDHKLSELFGSRGIDKTRTSSSTTTEAGSTLRVCSGCSNISATGR
jgi:hypothetical protein